MDDRFARERMIVGDEGMEKLRLARVAVFGIGGVGGYVIETLVRSGVGTLDIFDNDKICITNLNRQIIALDDTIGKFKTDVMKERALSINPEIVINAHNCFFMPENSGEYDFSKYSYVVDAIDTVTGKIEIIKCAVSAGVPVISCMGTGNKTNPALLETADIYETSVCPLARVMRRELKKRGIERLKVVYSKEKPITPAGNAKNDGSYNGQGRRSTPGSTAFVPAAAGLIAASEVVRAITGIDEK